jgi:hypothetical protein
VAAAPLVGEFLFLKPFLFNILIIIAPIFFADLTLLIAPHALARQHPPR